ncbi:hypothetical protein ACFL5O_05650 [Myxococcota bacterium]
MALSCTVTSDDDDDDDDGTGGKGGTAAKGGASSGGSDKAGSSNGGSSNGGSSNGGSSSGGGSTYAGAAGAGGIGAAGASSNECVDCLEEKCGEEYEACDNMCWDHLAEIQDAQSENKRSGEEIEISIGEVADLTPDGLPPVGVSEIIGCARDPEVGCELPCFDFSDMDGEGGAGGTEAT